MIDEIAQLEDEPIRVQRAVADLPPYRIGDLASFPNQSQAEICQHLEARAEPTGLRDGGGPLSVFIDCHDCCLLRRAKGRVQATIGRQAELNRNPGDGGHWPDRVESRCGAVAVGRTYLLPPLSSGGALLVRPWLRFHIPLIEPDRRIYRIRLSDKTSRLHPRRAATKLGQAYEPEVLVKVREWISSALASPDLVLEAQPPAQPQSRVVVEHPIRFAGGSNAKVVGPSAERLVQLIHQPCGLLPSTRSVGQRVDPFDHALDALL